jgi:hypothetical protein
VNPRYPVYVVSKGRWESRLTPKALEAIRVPYHIVVEEQERDEYARVIDPRKILVLDPRYQREFDPCDGHGDKLRLGPAPVRNFVWDHSIARGFTHHWVMDDNIKGFYRFNRNLKVPVADGAIFHAMEEFCLRFMNIAMAGPNYFMFAPRKTGHKIRPFTPNTRIYSCQFVRNDVPFRWRSRYNDDTDLSLRMLKAGWCTVLFNAFLQEKAVTMTVKGGNTPIYQQMGPGFDGRLEMAKALQRLHPDVTKVTRKWGRWQHHVDYRPFAGNRLVLRPGVEPPAGTDEFGMELRRVVRAGPDAGSRGRRAG